MVRSCWFVVVVAPFAFGSDEHQAVQAIRERIAAKGDSKATAYQVTIPNTTVSYDMVPIRAGEFTMGGRQGESRRVLDAGA